LLQVSTFRIFQHDLVKLKSVYRDSRTTSANSSSVKSVSQLTV